MSSEKQRYVLDIDMYLYANQDKKARKKVEKILRKLNKIYPNSHAKAKELHLQPFATMTSKKISLTEPNELHLSGNVIPNINDLSIKDQ